MHTWCALKLTVHIICYVLTIETQSVYILISKSVELPYVTRLKRKQSFPALNLIKENRIELRESLEIEGNK